VSAAPARALGALIIGDEILSGKRADKHLAHVVGTLAARGLSLDYAQYLGDDRARLTDVLRASFARDDIVFSFGGIGATPDDHTRQAAAAALGVPLERHPEALREIEARFGAEAYPHRVLMAEFPHGSRVIPNPYNRIAAFAIRNHHFFPGFPEMAWPMLEWVLDTWHPELSRERPIEKTVVVYDAGESQLLPLMDAITADYPR
jgi:molybdopterin-biosynthesis enzyme MoeA-like protein